MKGEIRIWATADEREGTDDNYTQEFSLKRAFPMGINIVCFALSR
jgi:hypothetical protein